MLAQRVAVDEFDGVDLVDYRHRVAGLFRLLIQARAIDQPAFMAEAHAAGWDVADLPASYRASVLVQIRRVADGIWRELIGCNSSGGVVLEDPLADLKAVVNEFVGNLMYLPVVVPHDFDWNDVGPWEQLNQLRTALSLLPERTAGAIVGAKEALTPEEVVLAAAELYQDLGRPATFRELSRQLGRAHSTVARHAQEARLRAAQLDDSEATEVLNRILPPQRAPKLQPVDPNKLDYLNRPR